MFNMVFTRESGSGSGASNHDRPGLTNDQIRGMIATGVATTIWGSILELLGSIKTIITKLFNDRYAALSKAVVAVATVVVAVVGLRGERSFQYQDFENMNPQKFDGVRDPIIVMRWLFDVEGRFFICSCSDDQNVKCTLNLLRLGAKD